VYANFVVEHLDAPLTAFSEWRRVVKPRGALILLASNRASPAFWAAALIPHRARLELKRAGAGVAEHDVIPTHYRANTPWRLHRLLASAGFRPVRIEYVATLHRYVVRAPRLAAILRAAEQRLPPALRSTIVGWYEAI
jgi:SAM-dependent methyltransferase